MYDLLQLEPEMIALSEEMAHDAYKPSSFKFLSDVAAVPNFPVCQVSNAMYTRLLRTGNVRTLSCVSQHFSPECVYCVHTECHTST